MVLFFGNLLKWAFFDGCLNSSSTNYLLNLTNLMKRRIIPQTLQLHFCTYPSIVGDVVLLRLPAVRPGRLLRRRRLLHRLRSRDGQRLIRRRTLQLGRLVARVCALRYAVARVVDGDALLRRATLELEPAALPRHQLRCKTKRVRVIRVPRPESCTCPGATTLQTVMDVFRAT